MLSLFVSHPVPCTCVTVTAGNKKERQGSEVLTLLLQALQSIISSEALPAHRALVRPISMLLAYVSGSCCIKELNVLKLSFVYISLFNLFLVFFPFLCMQSLLEMTVKGIPQRILGSASYQVGKMDLLNVSVYSFSLPGHWATSFTFEIQSVYPVAPCYFWLCPLLQMMNLK